MSHLSAERLAALADAGALPTLHESEHLALCHACADERLAYAALVAGARAERSTPGVPLTRWDGIAAGLRREGVLAGGSHPLAVGGGRLAANDMAVRAGMGRPRVHQLVPGRSTWMRAAAAILLFVGGVAAGRAMDGPAATPMSTATATEQPPTANPQPPTPEALIPEYRSVTEAQAALERFEVAYQHAAAFLAENDSTAPRLDTTEDYRTRLVALERAGNTMREAMEKAPYDPVLSGYYLTTLGQREATLRQLNVAVPAGARLNSF